MGFQQIYWLNRDLDFPIYLRNADGSAYNPGSAQYRFRVFSEPGVAVVDLLWGAGISLGDGPTGRLDVAAGALLLGAEYLMGSAELTRTDTGADVVAVWPVNIVREGSVPYVGTAGVTVAMATQTVAVATLSGFGGPAGPAGVAGPSSLVDAGVPLFPNGDFFWWDKGTGPFDINGVVANGIRLVKGAGSSHAVQRVSGFDSNIGGYALRWGRSVAGSAVSVLRLFVDNLARFHGKQVTLAFETMAGASKDFTVRLLLNYGTGGSAVTNQNASTHTASATPQTITKAGMTIDLTAKTVTDDSNLEIQLRRGNTDADGNIDFQKFRLWVGGTDYGMPLIERALQRQMLSRCLETIDTRTVNGTTKVYYEKKRTLPTATASVGTVSNVKLDSCDLTHTAAADTTITIDAEIYPT